MLFPWNRRYFANIAFGISACTPYFGGMTAPWESVEQAEIELHGRRFDE